MSLKVDSAKKSKFDNLNSLPLKWHLYSNQDEKSTVKVLYSILSKALDDNIAEEGISCLLSVVECENKTSWKGYRIQC